jgi:hypothetical protein
MLPLRIARDILCRFLKEYRLSLPALQDELHDFERKASRGLFSSLFLATLGILKGNGNASKRVCVRAVEPGDIHGCLLCRIPHLTEATT